MPNIYARMRSIIGTTADWAGAGAGLVLGDGEIAIERVSSTEVKAKVGDGTRPFSTSPYLGGGGTGTVTSVNGIAPVAGNVQVSPAGSAVTAADAGKAPILDGSGKLDISAMPSGLVKTVNAVGPDPFGNVAVSITKASAGTLAARPAAGTVDGEAYVVAGDPNTALNGDTYIWVAANSAWYQVSSFSYASADARYVNVSGDTMAGLLTLFQDPSNAMDAVTLQYLQNNSSNVYYTNVTPTGASVGDLFWDSGLNALKVYDGAAWQPLAAGGGGGGSGTVTSVSIVSANGLAGTVATPTTTPAITLSTTVSGMLKGTGTGGITAAVAGTDYTAANTAVPLAGGTMTGALVLNANPTVALGAATKQYVDAVLPAQAGNAGLYLTTNGTTASWAAVTAPIPAYGAVGSYLQCVSTSGGGVVPINVTCAGSSLATYRNLGCSSFAYDMLGLTGTWRSLGFASGLSASNQGATTSATLFIRIA